jgi:hypothetical protein
MGPTTGSRGISSSDAALSTFTVFILVLPADRPGAGSQSNTPSDAGSTSDIRPLPQNCFSNQDILGLFEYYSRNSRGIPRIPLRACLETSRIVAYADLWKPRGVSNGPFL